jgi:tetratricopeptide (TPR) repeat protein
MQQDRIEKLLHFLNQNPKDCFLNHALALEFVKLGDDGRARQYFENNLNNDAGYIATYYHLGKLLERQNEVPAAIAMYEVGMQKARAANDMHTYNELQAAHEDLVF